MSKTKKLITEYKAQWIDLRFTDTRGKEQHITIPAAAFSDSLLSTGKLFDGSSIAGWKKINESDMMLVPDDTTATLDPFSDEPTLNVRCNVNEPTTMEGYDRDPRTISQRAETYLITSGIADQAFFGPEPEFFIFDSIRWKVDTSSCYYKIDSEEAAWSSAINYEGGNLGHRPDIKGGYFPVPPVDSMHNIRGAMSNAMQSQGLTIEVHHHEVGTAGQCEISTKYNTLIKKADEVQIFKYSVHNVAHNYGKTATFMPKPLIGDNGSGMHIHLSLVRKNKNLFDGNGYAGLSDTALYFIGGIIKHAKALNAFTNASTNSYKRLIPGYEAPVSLAYSAKNRSAAIRIPFESNPQARRIEIRFPDPSANPYLAFSALLMAGIDGIQQKLSPGDPTEQDLYNLCPNTTNIGTVAKSLTEALDALDKDRAFLQEGNVFSSDAIDAYIALKRDECQQLDNSTHPVEFKLYYSL